VKAVPVMRPWVPVALLVIVGPAAAQDNLTVIKADGDNPPPRMLRAYLLAGAENQLVVGTEE
jgi:hypothetical protein